jgi:hypothetical protein
MMFVTVKRARRLRQLESQYTPFWKEFQKEISIALHHPHPEAARLDYLLEHLNNLTITPVETIELKKILREKTEDPEQSAEERQLAEFLLFAMPRVVRERGRKPRSKNLEMGLPKHENKN